MKEIAENTPLEVLWVLLFACIVIFIAVATLNKSFLKSSNRLLLGVVFMFVAFEGFYYFNNKKFYNFFKNKTLHIKDIPLTNKKDFFKPGEWDSVAVAEIKE